MAYKGSASKTLQFMTGRLSATSAAGLARLAKNRLVQQVVARELRKYLLNYLKTSRADSSYLPSVQDDRIAMAIAITESIHRGLRTRQFSDAYLRGLLQVFVKTLFIDRGNPEQRKQFQEAFGKLAPSFLLIAPGKACNLRCPGCYSDSDDKRNHLEWSLVDRIMEEAKSLWGERFFVISGGEPFAYRSEGKDIMDLFDKHQDCFFMVYTIADAARTRAHRLQRRRDTDRRRIHARVGGLQPEIRSDHGQYLGGPLLAPQGCQG